MTGFDWLAVSSVAGGLLGYVLKNKTELRNRLIPKVVLTFNLAKNLLVSAGLMPAGATVLAQVNASDSFFAKLVPDVMVDPTLMNGEYAYAVIPWLALGSIILNTFVDSTLPCGAHTILKNIKQDREEQSRKRKR